MQAKIYKKIYMIFYKNKQQGEINFKKLKPWQKTYQNKQLKIAYISLSSLSLFLCHKKQKKKTTKFWHVKIKQRIFKTEWHFNNKKQSQENKNFLKTSKKTFGFKNKVFLFKIDLKENL